MAANVSLKPSDPEGDSCWQSQHTRFVCQINEKEPDVLLLGDSMLQNFEHAACYKKHLEPLHCLNFCIHGDETQHVLWRVMNGELDGFSLKAIVLMVGTHNRHPASDVVAGIRSIVDTIKEKQYGANLIIMGLLPCGRDPNPKRTKHEEINKLLSAEFSTDNSLVFLCPDWDLFLQSNGTISHRDMYDYMHPTESGYAKFAEPLIEELQNSLHTFIKTDAPSSLVE